MGRIGFLGVGHLASAMVAGLLRAGVPGATLLLSGRGQGAATARRFGLDVAADNAALVTACTTVVLAVRPHHAVEAITGLPWRDGQTLVSACAGIRIAPLAKEAAPARVARIMPLTAAEWLTSPTTLVPDDAVAARLLAHLGPVIPLASEAEFETATVTAAIYGWAQTLIRHSVAWSTAHGLAEDAARQLVANTFVAAGRNVSASAEPLENLLGALVTPGGITERGLEVLDGRGLPAIWASACDAVLAKLTGAGPVRDLASGK